MVSLFFARLDQYFIIFKDPNVFEFSNFPFKTKQLFILDGKTIKEIVGTIL